MSARTAFPDSLDPTTLWALRAVLVPMHPTIASHPDLTAITVFLASTATPARGGLPYLDAVLPAEDRLAATRVVRDLGALPPDAILYLLAQPLLDLASDHLVRDRSDCRIHRRRCAKVHSLVNPHRSLHSLRYRVCAGPCMVFAGCPFFPRTFLTFPSSVRHKVTDFSSH